MIKIINYEALYQRAIATWGVEAQIRMVFEEMAELQATICKYLRHRCDLDDVSDEMADLEIMLGQLKVIFHNANQVEDRKAYKARRLQDRLEGACDA